MLQISYLILTTPLLYDFYNYNVGEQEFNRLLHEFLQVLLNPLMLYHPSDHSEPSIAIWNIHHF